MIKHNVSLPFHLNRRVHEIRQKLPRPAIEAIVHRCHLSASIRNIFGVLGIYRLLCIQARWFGSSVGADRFAGTKMWHRQWRARQKIFAFLRFIEMHRSVGAIIRMPDTAGLCARVSKGVVHLRWANVQRRFPGNATTTTVHTGCGRKCDPLVPRY